MGRSLIIDSQASGSNIIPTEMFQSWHCFKPSPPHAILSITNRIEAVQDVLHSPSMPRTVRDSPAERYGVSKRGENPSWVPHFGVFFEIPQANIQAMRGRRSIFGGS